MKLRYSLDSLRNETRILVINANIRSRPCYRSRQYSVDGLNRVKMDEPKYASVQVVEKMV